MDKNCEIYKADVHTTNLKYNNFRLVPVELYLDVQKVVISYSPGNKARIITCLEFVYEKFLNLKKLKFVLEGIYTFKIYDNVTYFEDIITNKIALLQKMVSMRTCITKYHIPGQCFYGITSDPTFRIKKVYKNI